MIRRYMHILLAIVAAGSVLTAQEVGKKVALKPGQAVTAGNLGKTELRFAVTGLTQDNVTKVKDALTALSFQTYVCGGCKYEQSAAGRCGKCNVDLTPEKKPLFAGATPLPAENAITLTLDQGHVVRLSEIERTLGTNSVQIASDRFPIIGSAELIVRGATQQSMPGIEKALRDANLFNDIVGSFDQTTSEIHFRVRAGTTPPMRTAVVTAIESAGVHATLNDVVWGPVATKI